jgi:hypothetical protein
MNQLQPLTIEGYEESYCRFRDGSGNCVNLIPKSDDKYPYDPYKGLERENDKKDKDEKKEWHDTHLGLMYMGVGVALLGVLALVLVDRRK